MKMDSRLRGNDKTRFQIYRTAESPNLQDIHNFRNFIFGQV
jgi:hypothetical protein